MTSKRPYQDPEGLFLSRKSASDIVNGDIDSPGSYIAGRIFSKNSTKKQYTVDIRQESSPKAAYLDVVIEDKLQKRLELLVGDHLHISLKGAHLLPHSGPASHVPAVLRFREGITILLVSRAGLQGEKGKLFHVWPGSNANKAKKRRCALDTDVNWFSTPPPGDTHFGAVESAPSLEAVISPSGSSSLPPSVPRSPTLPPSSLPLPSLVHPGQPQITDTAESSTAGAALPTPRQSTPRAKSRTGATYAYRTTPNHEEFAPINLISLPESPTASGSATATHSMLGEAPLDAGRTASAVPARSSSEPQNGVLRCPQPVKHKSGRKKKRDEHKRLVASSGAAADSPASAEIVLAVPAVSKTEHITKEHSNGQTESDVVPAREETPPEVTQSGSNEDADGTAKGLSGDDDDPDLSMRAGLVVNGWPYTALSDIRDRALMSVIGVVSSVGKEPTRTTTGDWCTCFSLLDPSVLDSFGGVLYADGVGIKLNCFMKVEQWVPNPKRGDVVLLRQVKIQHWKDKFTGTCFANTMQWAIYDPDVEKLLRPDPGLSNSRNHCPPSWDVLPPEIEYCVRLVKWWAAVQRTRAERRGTAIQIGGGPITAVERKAISRQHLLIRDADPGREPRGYFNCTVEVLHGHANHISDIYSIYVTDYTSKSGTFVQHSEWCPVSLADRVLRIEMWRGEAVALGQQMNPGEYWLLDNVRMKLSNGGYIEGSFSEAVKARKLSVADIDTNHHLQALLQRKKAWEENDANPNVFPHRLFSEVELQSIFDCTVEVLYAEYNATGTSLLYITDYTERADLATPPTALWSRDLQGRIVTLELQGPQSKMADKVDIGAFFNVKHMRLIERVTGVGRVVGRIGGPDRLIHKLNANNPNEELEQLLRRRKQREENKAAAVAPRTESFTTIARILKCSKPAEKFQVRAQVVGTFPLQLSDCVVRCCRGCSERVPESSSACTACTTSEEGMPPGWDNMFHLFLRLQDERGNAQITVSVDQNSSLLRGLSPDDVVGASDGTVVVRERLADYIGNLEAVQAANSLGRTIAVDVPVREFTIESWQVVEDDATGVVAYGLA